MLGKLIGSAISLAGGLIGQSNTASANAAARKQTAEIARKQNKMAQKNIRLQKDFAQQGIRWKVEDAIRAGIHPLYALGAQTNSFAPVSVGSASYSPQVDSSLPNALANIGQDVSRAITATRTQGERDIAYENTVKALTLKKMDLENQLLGSQVAKNMQVGPSMPGDILGPLAEKPGAARPRIKLGGDWWETNPWVSSAQDLEDRYGEEGPLARYAIPSITVGGDVVHNSLRAAQWLWRNGLQRFSGPPGPWWLYQ